MERVAHVVNVFCRESDAIDWQNRCTANENYYGKPMWVYEVERPIAVGGATPVWDVVAYPICPIN